MPRSTPVPLPDQRIRVAVFGSFYRGFHVLHDLLHGPIASRVQVVGVATDDPGSGFISAERRVWQYPHAAHEETMVAELARKHGLDPYLGRITDEAFHQRLEQQWRPELCMMATFGQRIQARSFDYPRLGFYNLHPCIDDGCWPSRYAGGNPFQAMSEAGETVTQVAFHAVDAGFDTGRLIAWSEPVAMPPHASVTDMHKLTAPTAARLAVAQIQRILDQDSRTNRAVA